MLSRSGSSRSCDLGWSTGSCSGLTCARSSFLMKWERCLRLRVVPKLPWSFCGLEMMLMVWLGEKYRGIAL